MLEEMFCKNHHSLEVNKKAKEIEKYIEFFLRKNNITPETFIHDAMVNSEKLKEVLGNPGNQLELIKSYFSLIQLVAEWKPLVNIVLEVAKAQFEKDNQKEVVH